MTASPGQSTLRVDRDLVHGGTELARRTDRRTPPARRHLPRISGHHVRPTAPDTNAQITRHGIFSRDEIEALLRALGFKAPGKIYEVFFDGSSSVCGGAPWPPSLPGRVPVVFLKGTPPGSIPCDANGFAGPGQPSGYLEMDEVHEILHTLGMAPDCAPHSIKNGHVNESPTDLMYQGPLPWDTAQMVLDYGRDDYFQAHISGCLDVSHSAFLEGGTQMPPAWNAPPPLAPICVVPRNVHMTLAGARTTLKGAYCRLGRVRDVSRAPRKRVRRVVAQSPAPGAVHQGGFSVSVTVAVVRPVTRAASLHYAPPPCQAAAQRERGAHGVRSWRRSSSPRWRARSRSRRRPSPPPSSAPSAGAPSRST